MPALAEKSNLWECLQKIASDGGRPIESIRLIEQNFIQPGRTVQANGSADESVDVLQIRIQATIIRQSDHDGVWLLLGKGTRRMSHCLMCRCLAARILPDTLLA